MSIAKTAIAILFVAALTGCATKTNRASEQYPAGPENAAQIASLQESLRAANDQKAKLERAGLPGASTFFGTEDLDLRKILSMSSDGRREKVIEIVSNVAEFRGQLIERVQSELQSAIVKEFGPPQSARNEEVALEALDSRGNVIEVPVTVETRPLRRISDRDNAARLPMVLGLGRPVVAGYEGLLGRVTSTDSGFYRRIYTGDAADAIALESRTLVLLKGGECKKPRINNASPMR